MFGSGDIYYHFVHVYNLCDAFMLCAEKDEALGEVFIIGDEHATKLNDVVRIMAETLGVSPPRLKLPYALLYTGLGGLRSGMQTIWNFSASVPAPRSLVQFQSGI